MSGRNSSPVDDDAPLFPESDLPEHIARSVGAERAKLVREWRLAQGDEAARGGRGRTRERVEDERAGQQVLDTADLWDIDKLEEQAQLELQKQLRHADPKIRRDAAKEMIDFAHRQRKQGDDEITQVVYLAPDVAPQFDVDAANAFARTL